MALLEDLLASALPSRDVYDIWFRARAQYEKGIAESRDNAHADAIKKFRPEIEKLEREIDAYKFIVECHESTIRQKGEQLAGANLLNDFLRNQVQESAKKLDEAKEIIKLVSYGYTARYEKVPDCLCSQCTFDTRITEFLEAA